MKGFPLGLPWKPLLVYKGLNLGQNIELLSALKRVVVSAIILLNKVALKFLMKLFSYINFRST